MDLLTGLRAFVATAQSKSFTAAAEQLGISNRLTSKYVAALEDHLGERLLQRTTRRVGLTPVGEQLLARAPVILDDLDDVLADISEGGRGFGGAIRVAAPVTFGEVYVAEMLGRFQAEHPDLTVTLHLDDGFADLASQGLDLAFRVGAAEMQSVKARRLGTMDAIVAASPAYLAAHGVPQHPEDLHHHTCVLDTNRKTPKRWGFARDGQDRSVAVSGPVSVNSARAACALAVAGHGVACGPRFAFQQALDAGQLERLLPMYTGDAFPVSAVYLEGRVLPRKSRALIDFALSDFRTAFGR